MRIGAKFSDIIVTICSPLACCFPKVRNCVIGLRAVCAPRPLCDCAAMEWHHIGHQPRPYACVDSSGRASSSSSSVAAGSSMVNVDPSPVRDQTEIRPPFSCTQCLVMAKPSPEPPVSRERAGSTRPVRARPAVRDSAWPSPSTACRRTAVGFRSGRVRGRGRRSPSSCRPPRMRMTTRPGRTSRHKRRALVGARYGAIPLPHNHTVGEVRTPRVAQLRNYVLSGNSRLTENKWLR